MEIYQTNFKSNKTFLALGSETAGNFSIYNKGKIFYYSGFKDLLAESNFKNISNSIATILKKDKLRPEVILADLHPNFSTIPLGDKLSKKYGANFVRVQHHLAHIFSAIGEEEIICRNPISTKIVGMACDGTGYGEDGNIWGGEIFSIDLARKSYKRIGHLENQILLGGEQAILHPARMLISILSNFLEKDEIYGFVKKYFSANEFELLFNLLQKKFNCFDTSSAGRVLDAVSVLLGFFSKEVTRKHEAIDALEQNSNTAYPIEPKIIYDIREAKYILDTTYLFEYLIKNFDKDKKRLAATAQIYLAKGMYTIASKRKNKIYFGGGIANNKIMSEYLMSKKVILNKELKRGDDALSFGQIIFGLKML